jgi:glycosyltransferase involved in cell wall biosynthesis
MTIPLPIHVCFISPKAYPLLNPACQATFGGAEVDLYLLGTELAKDVAFKVSFIVADYGQPQQETKENIAVFKSLTFQENIMSGVWKLWLTMKKVNAAVYFFEAASAGVFLIEMFCRFNKRVFIYRTANSGECDGTLLKKSPFVRRLFNYTIRRADKVLTQNHADRETLFKKMRIESQVIANGHRLNQIAFEKKHVLWVGRSDTIKGPDRFLELAVQFPQEIFVMICPKATEDKSYEQLKKRADAIPNVRFIPKVEYNEIDKYFSQSKIFVNTSDSEGFPNTFVQAAAAATAILSYVVNPDEFLTRHNCGLACGADMEKLKTGLAFLLENNHYLEIGQNGRKYAEQTHDIVKIIEQYKTLFRTLTGGAK